MRLVDHILRHLSQDVVSATDLAPLLGGTAESRRNQVKRAVAAGHLVRLRRGLYALAPMFRRQGLHPFAVAARLVDPSYISFESALSHHGLIPEAVYTTTCASLKRKFDFTTAVGTFAYQPIPARAFMQEVERVETGPHIFLMGSPLKALTDLVYAKHLPWLGVKPLIESLRIDIDDLKIEREALEDIERAFRAPRISRFLQGLQKDLAI